MIFKNFRTYQIEKKPFYADNTMYMIPEKRYDSLLKSIINKIKVKISYKNKIKQERIAPHKDI